MGYLIATFSFLATFVALFGTTYDRKRGALLRRITPVGYATLAVAIAALSAAFIDLHRNNEDRRAQGQVAIEYLFSRSVEIGRSTVELEIVIKAQANSNEKDEGAFETVLRRLGALVAVLDQRMIFWRQVLPADIVIAADNLSDTVHDELSWIAEKGRLRENISLIASKMAEASASLNRKLCALPTLTSAAIRAVTFEESCRPDGLEWKSAEELRDEIMKRADEL